MNRAKQKFALLLTTLNTISPLATLERGYAIASVNQSILFDSNQIACGEILNLRLAKGQLVCEVIKKKDN